MLQTRRIVNGFLIIVFVSGAAFFVLEYKNYRSEVSALAYKKARDSDRLTHVNILASAVEAYIKDHEGRLPGPISNNASFICRSDLNKGCEDLLDLKLLLESYIVAIPGDPFSIDDANSHYMIKIDKGHIIVSAPNSETKPIHATR